jgi:6-phosphogluconolactonase
VILTGGDTAAKVYGAMANLPIDWPEIEVIFSDERAVPPTSGDSNYGMASRVLFEPAGIGTVHRMRGEDDPADAAYAYETEIADLLPSVTLAVLGMGADCHIAGLFPGSPALKATGRAVVAIERPDGLLGISLTFPALRSAARTLVIVSGKAKAAAVARALETDEPPATCPVHFLHDPQFILDASAASHLTGEF